jgi:aquaporin Z
MRAHWREYVSEAAGLGTFMFVACVLGTLLGHPDSPVVQLLPDAFVRRLVMGLAMGLTAVSLIYSPWGRRSGAHFNPATTLTFWRLGKVTNADAGAYAIAQAIGGLGGVAVAALVIGPALGHPEVRYVTTVPGSAGIFVAFVAEIVLTLLLMTVVLELSNTAALERFTGLVAGALVALYITLEAPLSGMSMNPARSLASAVPAGTVDALWIYLVAPPLGMLIAAEVYARRRGLHTVYCAKLNHGRVGQCIFRCRHAELRGR